MSSVLSKETCMRGFVALNVVFMVLYIQVYTKMDNFVPAHLAQPKSDVHRIDCELDLLSHCLCSSEHTHQVLSNKLISDLILILSTLIAHIHASRIDRPFAQTARFLLFLGIRESF